MTSTPLSPAHPGNAVTTGINPVGGQTVLRGPVWSLRVEGRRVAIVLQGAPLPGGAELSELVIFLPHVSFPFDFREGIERFRHHRGDAELLEIAVDARALLDWLHRVSGGRIGGTAHDDTLVLSGRTRHGARYTVRARLVADGQPSGDDDEPTLVLSLFQVRVYGNVTEPWPVLAGRVIDLLPKELIVDRTLTTARIRLVRPALAWALSALGWKLPDLSRLRARGVELRAGRLVARFVSESTDYGRLLSLEAMEDQGLRGAFERFVEDLELKRHHGQVDRLLGQRQIREALAEVYRALDGPPQPGFLAERLIGIAASQPILFDEGERVCKDLLRVSPDYEPALCGLASIALGRGRREEAAMQLERLAGLLTGPGDREDATAADLSVSEILRDTAHKEARQALQRVLERSPDHEEALEALIALTEAEGDTRATLPLYKRLLFAARSQQRTRDAGLRLARHALERGQAEDARVFLRVVLDASPTDLEAQLALAEVEERNDDPAEAVRILEGALRSVPATDTAHVARLIERLGRLALDRLGDAGKTKRVLWRAIDLDPIAPEDAIALAQLALDAGEPVLVERHLEAVPAGGPWAAQADILRAKALLARGKPERALEITFAVLEVEPHNGAALDLIERCTPDLGERELLVNQLAESARRVPSGAGRARILARVGGIYESLGLGWDAIAPYETALDEASDSPEANGIAERLLALYGEFGMWPKHQELCRVRLPKKREPAERVALLLRIGRVALRELADPEQARPFLEEAVTLAPRHLEALSLYREALERLQQGIALIRVLSRLESLHPDEHARNEARIRLAELQLDGLDAPGQARATLSRLPPETNADPRVIALKQRLGLLPRPPAADAAARSPDASYAAAVRLADEGRDVEALELIEGLTGSVPARELEGLLRARLATPGKRSDGAARAADAGAGRLPVPTARAGVAVTDTQEFEAPPGRAGGDALMRPSEPRSGETRVVAGIARGATPRPTPRPQTAMDAAPAGHELDEAPMGTTRPPSTTHTRPIEDLGPRVRSEATAPLSGLGAPGRGTRDGAPGDDDVVTSARSTAEATLEQRVRESEALEAAMKKADERLHRGDAAGARGALEAALAIDPHYATALETLVEVLRTLDDHEARAATLERLLETVFDAEKSVIYLRELGHVLADNLQRHDAALEHWLRYLLWRPLDGEIFERVRARLISDDRYVELAELYERKADAWEDAEYTGTEPGTARRRAAAALRDAAEQYLAGGRAQLAADVAQHGLRLASDDPELLEMRVRALVAAGDRAAARATLDQLTPLMLDGPLKDELLGLVSAEP